MTKTGNITEQAVAPPPVCNLGEKGQETFEQDTPCLACGYNLRGLAGDPCVCPECGRANALALLRAPGELVAKELEKMAVLAVLGPGALMITLVVVAGVVWLEIMRRGGMDPVLFVLPLVGVLGWPLGCLAFGRACRFKTGWLAVLGWFHLAVFLGLPGLFALALILLFLLGAPNVWAVVAAYLALFVGLPGVRFIVRRLCKRDVFRGVLGVAKDKLAVFGREFAAARVVEKLTRQRAREQR